MREELVELNPEIHFDYLSSFNEGGVPIKESHIIKGISYVFALQFGEESLVFKDIEQLEIAKEFFSKKIRPSTNGHNPPFEHYWHSWFGRLPKKFLKATNREKILKAIETALKKYENTRQV